MYVVDRPGHGRSPLHPDLHGGFPATHITLESLAGRFTPPAANPANVPNEYQKNHNQWPGPGNVGSPDLDQLVAGLGGSYVQTPPPPGAAPGTGRQGGGRAGTGRRRGWTRCGAGRSAAGCERAARGSAQRAASRLASGRRRSARQDRPGDHHDPLRRRSLRSARRRGAARAGEGHRDHRRRGIGIRRRQPLGHVERPGHLRSAGQRSGRDQDDLRRQPRTRHCRLLPAGRARAQAAESQEHQGRVRDRRLVVRLTWQSRRRRVPEAGRRAGRRDSSRRARHQGQRPHDDGRDGTTARCSSR